MKRLILLLCLGLSAAAQTHTGGGQGAGGTVTVAAGAPSSPCATKGSLYIDSNTNFLYFCPSNGGTWTQNSASAGAVAFSSVTNGTASSKAFVVGSSSTLTPTSATVGEISANYLNGTQLSGLTTGLLKVTTTTGAVSTATSGTDYAPATSGSSILSGNGSGGFTNVTLGSNLSFTTGTLSLSGVALTANPLSQFASTTSAQLAGVLSDETGTGVAVFGTSPTISGVTLTGSSALGTPASLTLTNAGGLPLSGLVAQGADTIVMNATGGSAAPTAVAGPSGGTNGCAGATNAATYNTTTHAWGCNTISGSGTVNSGTASHLAYYASSTTAVSDMGADFTFATHTLTGGASSILDLHSAATTGLLLPGGLTTGLVTVTTSTGAISSVAAPSGTVVGTSDSQTLTNKSIAGSEINSGTVGASFLPTATSGAKGVVQGDGATLTITAGVIACTTATNSQIGCVEPDDSTITISGGVISAVSSAVALSSLTAAAGAHTLANGNNGAQVWNWAQTTNSQTAFTFGETTAATGTSDLELLVKTIAGSTAIPLTAQNSLTGSQALPALQVTPTWNTTGVVDAALLVNPTNTASGAGSLLADFQLGGTSEWKVDKTGQTTQSGPMNVASDGVHAGIMETVGNTTVPAIASNSTGWIGPNSASFTSYVFQPSATAPSASGPMLVGAVSSNVTQVTYGTTTGTGTVYALATSPTFVTPTLGAALATSINGLTITSSTGTLTIANSKTATINNSITFAGTDSTTMTFPSSSATVAGLGIAQTFSAANTFSAAGAASTPGVSVTGAPYTAGSATTNFPQLYLNAGTGPTTFSTAGTELGVNAPSGFTGNFLDFHINGGASVASLSSSGVLTVSSCSGCGSVSLVFPVTVSGTTTSGGVPYFSNATTLTSSAALASNALVFGGGAGGSPATGNGDFTYTTHTLASAASGILDMSLSSVTAGFKIPSGAAAAPTADGILAENTSNHTFAWGSNGTTMVGAIAATGTGTATTCTNQAITSVSSLATPTCSTITSAFTDTSIAHTGVDINTSYQVTVTHLVSALPAAQGGTGISTSSSTGVPQISSGTWSVSTALASGTTGTTQSQGDNSTKLSTTAYTDLAVANAVAGVNPAVAVVAASTASLTGTYSNGVSGVGATFTVTATGAFTLDGVSIGTIGQRVLLKNQGSAFQNGVYTATIVGTTGVSPVFTRALDYDTPSEMNSTGAVPVQSGTANATTSWLLTSTVTTIGTDALTYVQFSIAPTTLVTASSPGIGLCHFAGSTQACTSSAVNLASADVTGVLPVANGGTNNASLTFPSGTATVPQTVASGQTAMPTGALSGNACSASATTATATGSATTDAVEVTYASDPTGVTGYGGGTGGGITVRAWPTSNTMNFKLCNESSGSITPGALNINWRVVR